MGPHGCNPETEFGDETPAASKLLRSFHELPVEYNGDATSALSAKKDAIAAAFPLLSRISHSGSNSTKRPNGNEVDLVHPFCVQWLGEMLVLSGGNVGLDVLQSYLDSMVDVMHK